MRSRLLAVLVLALLPCLSVLAAADPDIRDTRLLTEPAIGPERIAFIYANDLWTCALDGGDVRRLTSDVGVESSPAFSQDGKWIAFSAQYEGNIDVYVVPAAGGVPKRLTWHPGNDIAQSFTPDGRSVLFTSPRAVHTLRYTHLFTVPVEGGAEQRLSIPHANAAVYSPDGARIAYNPLSPRFLQWKRYRGGTVSQVWLFDNKTHAVEKVPQPESRANDAGPMWIGEQVYFRSDRDGEFNLWSYHTRSKELRRLTNHSDFPVANAAAGGGRIVYEQAGYLHLFDPASGSARKLTIGVAADLPETRPRFVRQTKDREYIREYSLSPSAARLAVNFRGEIVTVPAEKGDVRNLTNSTDIHERSPIWSPDGRSIAYFSDAGGEYRLHIAAQDAKGKVTMWKLPGAGFYEFPAWSPDSKRIAYVDNSRTLWWIDVASGVSKKVASDHFYGPQKNLWPAWSPDSKWITYAASNASYIERVHVYSIDQNKSFPVTDGLSDASDPVFDRSGKYLFFFSSTNAGPVKNWFTLETVGQPVTRSIWVAVLRKDLPNPLIKRSDEEKGATAAADTKTNEGDDAAAAKSSKAAKVEPVRIDLDGLQNRILDLPVAEADLRGLETGPAGQVFFLRAADGKSALQRFDLESRETATLLPDVASYQISADAKKLVYRVKDDWAIASATDKKIEPKDGKDGKLKLMDAIEVRVDPRSEWPEMFAEAWRINRDYFYDPQMHGVDWKAMRDKYAAFLPHLTVRQDLNRVMRAMLSELSVGHSYITNAGDVAQPKSVPGGLLGADYAIENGRYRFTKVYGGLNWNPELRAPLTEPGANVSAGEYLISVGGRDVRPPANLFSFFENTSGKLTDITVGPNPDGRGSRTVSVVPVESEAALRNRDWVEGNLRAVDAATGGRVAYVYVPNTASLGHAYFTRYFFPQSHKQAVIIDERFNGGGSVADYYIDVLQRKEIAWWAMRYGPAMKTPSASIQGPKVMIADETAASGGDLLPWMFKKFQLGPVIGTRTWGGLIGILGYPELMDGGVITAPNLAFYDPDQGWTVEGQGVPPDIEVEMTPADVIAGRDPQLERAIQIVMDELKKNPTPAVKLSAYPNRSGNGAALGDAGK